MWNIVTKETFSSPPPAPNVQYKKTYNLETHTVRTTTTTRTGVISTRCNHCIWGDKGRSPCLMEISGLRYPPWWRFYKTERSCGRLISFAAIFCEARVKRSPAYRSLLPWTPTKCLHLIQTEKSWNISCDFL